MQVPRGYPELSAQEKLERLRAGQEFFAALRVKVTELELRAFLNATAWIPWAVDGYRYFQPALDKAVRLKADGYQTAPQPGEIWQHFRSLIPSGLWEYRPNQGAIPPQFYSRVIQAQRRLEGGVPRPKAIGAGKAARALELIEESFPGSVVVAHRTISEEGHA